MKTASMDACLEQFLSRQEEYDRTEWWQREDLMAASLCFQAGAAYEEKGNAFCEKVEPEYCIYSILPALQMLFGYQEELSPVGKEKLERLLRESQEELWKEAKKDKKNSFHLIALAGIAGWSLYGEEEKGLSYVQMKLEQFRQHCMHYDAPDESISPFYSALQLAALALLGELLVDTEEGETAKALENYLWKGLLEHCHPRLPQLAGPYSRGYVSELAGHPQAVLGALEAVLGLESPFSMERMLWTEENQTRILPHGSLDCTRVHALYFASIPYHCDQDLLRFWKQRTYPCRLHWRTHTDASYDVSIKKTVSADRKADYPADDVVQQTLLGENYAVGWADGEYENGMACNSFGVLYEKGGMARTFFTKLTSGEKYPGQWNTFEGIQMRLGAGNFPDEGRKYATEADGGWKIHYTPRAFCAGAGSLRLLFVIPEHFGPVDEIRLGDQVIDGGQEGKELPLEPLTVRDGALTFWLTPLDGDGCWKVVRKNQFLNLEWQKPVAEIEHTEWNLFVSL